MTYEVVWSGASKDVYLCIPEFTPPILREFPCEVPGRSEYVDWSQVRAQMLLLLEERPQWKIKDLREQLGITAPVIAGLVFRAQQAGLVRRPYRGVVRLIRRKVA